MTAVGGAIATHNHVRWAEGAIRSLAAEVDELVVVDDGSSDGSAELVASLATELGFRWIRHSDARGVSEAYNAAIRSLRSDIVLIQGGDDRTLPGRAAASAAALMDPAVALVHSTPVVIDALDQVLPAEVAAEFQTFDAADPLEVLFREGNFICAPSASVRRFDYLDAGGFPSNIDQLQDYALWLELAARGRFVRLGEPVVEYRKHAGNLSREVGVDDVPRSARESFERNWIRNRFLDRAGAEALERIAGLPGEGFGVQIETRRLLLRLSSEEPELVRRGLVDLFDRLAAEGDAVLVELGIDRGALAELVRLGASASVPAR